MNALEELRKIRALSDAGHDSGAADGEADAAPEQKVVMEDREHQKGREVLTSSVADVVRTIVTGAERPIPHSQILREMVGRGYAEAAARQAIAACQQNRWIAHNLVSGYVARTV